MTVTLTLADVHIAEAGPGAVRLLLPGYVTSLLLTAADLDRLSYMVRGDEPEPPDPAA